MTIGPSILMVPGMREHHDDHWLAHLKRELAGSVCVRRPAPNPLCCRARVAALDEAIATARSPVLIVAHSLGAIAVAHWAREHPRAILGALLVTPPDLDVPLPDGYPPPHVLEENGWLPTPMERLPFQSIVAASTNDPLARFTRTIGMARAWGSKLVRLGNVGHMNPASGFGPWHEARTLVRQLMKPVCEQA